MSGTPPRWGSPPPLYSGRGGSPRPYIPCPRPQWPYMQSPVPVSFSPIMWMPPPSPYFGVPIVEPPGPLRHEPPPQPPPTDGRSTADIIAAQSQDYIDEKLAEYQATIYLLQGRITGSSFSRGSSPLTSPFTSMESLPTSSPAPPGRRFDSKTQFDVHIQQLKDEQERVQKKTFVNWINSYLTKRNPPLRIDDLIEDLKDGTNLLALLEVLSGERLNTEKGRNLKRPHFLSNANTALTFLQSKKIKLVNINASDLVDGRPPVVLGLIWTIILYFQIEQKTQALASFGHSLDSVDGHKTPDPTGKKKDPARTVLLKWVTSSLPKDVGLQVKDFGPSWRDGIAFLAVVDAIKKGLIDLAALRRATNRDRLETAFSVAERELGIHRLLDPEDVDVDKPDEKSIMTYVAQFLHKYPELRSDSGDRLGFIESEYMELRTWLIDRTQYLASLNTLPDNYSEYSAFESEMNAKAMIFHKLAKLVDSKSSISIAPESWREIDILWKKLEAQMKYWLLLLDSRLPPPFCQIGEWLYKADIILNDYDIPPAMNEETATIISRKLEEHKAFFADLVTVENQFVTGLNQKDYQGFIPQQQLDNMGKRLRDVATKASIRRIRLKFLEHKCCLIAFMELTENKVRSWTVKYGTEQRVQQLLDQYNNFVSKNKIFQEFNKAFIDMQHVIEEYKRDGNIDQKESIQVDRFIKDTADRWKGVCMELKCVQSMLEELISFWRRWNTLSRELEDWITVSEPKLALDEEARMEYFQDIGIWKNKYQLLSETVSFLISTSEDQIGQQLREKYRVLTSRWEQLFANTKQYMEAGQMLRQRKEYRHCMERLQAWLSKSEGTLGNCQLDSTEKIKVHIQELQGILNEIGDYEELFKTISRLFQNLIQDLSRDEVERMMNTLKGEKERIVKLRARVGQQIQLLHQVVVQQQSLEESQKEITAWLVSAEEFLDSLSLKGNRENLQANLDRHKSFFSRTLYYKSMLESKNKALASMLASLKNAEGINPRDFGKKMVELNDQFNSVCHKASSWEQKLNEAIRGWQNLLEVERVISEWLTTADKLISEKHVDSKQVIDNHKSFFEHVNERWIQDLANAVQDLIKCLPYDEHENVLSVSNIIKDKWKKTITSASLHLVMLEFRQEEISFAKSFKDFEKELNSEIQAFDKNENVEIILKRNNELLTSPINGDIKRCLGNMERTVRSADKWPREEVIMKETIVKLREEWNALYKKAQDFALQLATIPNQWEAYKAKFREMDKWMDTVDDSIRKLLQELATAEEFEKERLVFQGICREVESKREDMKWMVQTLDSLMPNADRSNQEQQKLEQLILRYKKLIPVIEMTVVRTELYSKCYLYKKEVSEICKLLDQVISSCDVSADAQTDEGISRMLVAQEQAVAELDNQRSNVISMIQKGKELGKEPSAPEFIKHQTVSLETQWNKTYDTSLDKLNSLKASQKTWNAYNTGKSELLELIEKAEVELRNVTKRYGGERVAGELKKKQELAISLRMATENLLSKLQFFCKELSVAHPQAQQLIMSEVNAISNRLASTLSVVEKRIDVLNKEVAEWNDFENNLSSLNVWAVDTAPKEVSQISSVAVPQERLVRVQGFSSETEQKKQMLGYLKQKGQALLADKNDVVCKDYIEKLQRLELSLQGVERSVVEGQAELQKGVATWQEFESSLDLIKPWLEEAETKMSTGMPKPVVLADARNHIQQIKEFMISSAGIKSSIDQLKQLSLQLPQEMMVANSVDAYQSRWSGIDSALKQRANKLEKLIAAWQELEDTSQQVKEWLERPVLQKIVNNPNSIEINIPPPTQIEQLKGIKQELLKTQSSIVALAQAADLISSGLTMEGSNLLKAKVASLKSGAVKVSDAVNSRANFLSEILITGEELNAKLSGLSGWIDETNEVSSRPVSPDSVDSILQAYHVALNEHGEKRPVISEINDLISKAEASGYGHAMKIDYEPQPLFAEYETLAKSLQAKIQAVEKWRETVEWVNTCKDQLKYLEYQIESDQPIDEVTQKLDHVEMEIASWQNVIPLVEKMCHESKVNVVEPLPWSEIKHITAQANQIKSAILAKQQAKASMEERWTKFQDLQDNLSQAILKSHSDIQDIIHSYDNCGKSEGVLRNIEIVLQGLNTRAGEKDFLMNEGKQLMKDDKKNTVVIQNILSSIELNWEKTGESIKESSIVLKELIAAWKGFKDHEANAYSLLKEAQNRLDHEDVPTDLTSATDLSTRVDQAIVLSDRAKTEVDNMDNKLQIILRTSASFPTLDCSDLERSIQTARQSLNELSKKSAAEHQQRESQIVIWRQIDENKGDLLLWLEQKNNILSQCLQDLTRPDANLQHLSKYKNELPTYKELQVNISEKAQQLAELSGGFVSPNIAAMEDVIEEQFQEVTKLANDVESSLNTLKDSENSIKSKTKDINDAIGRIREKIIQCNNLTGENDVILGRLQECRSLKGALGELDTGSIESDINDFLREFPSATQSSAVKEANSLKNRHSDVCNQASKVEGNLLAYLIKYHTEKLSAFQREVANYNDKLVWCEPEHDNDRNSLETKFYSLVDIDKGLTDCSRRQTTLKESLDKLIAIGFDSADRETLVTDQAAVLSEFNDLVQKYNKCYGKLSGLVNVWKAYDSQHDDVAIGLKDIESNLKSLVTTHTELSTISNKLDAIDEIGTKLLELEPPIESLEKLGSQLTPNREDSRVIHSIGILRNKFVSLQKLASSYKDRLLGIKEKESAYEVVTHEAEKWVEDASGKLDGFKQVLSTRLPIQKYKPLLEQMNFFNESREHGHSLINRAVESGEALFPEITPENRELIRVRLRALRNKSETLIDNANAIAKTIEGAMLRRNSFDDCFTQVAQWIIETDKKLKEGSLKEPTLQEKKLALHQYRNLQVDIQSHEAIFKQLQEKSAAFSDADATKKLVEIEERYADLNSRAGEKVNLFEKCVRDHEEYSTALEKSCDFLRTLISEEALSDKDGEETKLAIIENLLTHQSEGEVLIKKCEELQKAVLDSTDASGHDAIIKELNEHKEAWRLFLARCANNVDRLRQLYSKWGKLSADIEEAMNWMKAREVQVKDQSLKSNHANKKLHLDKLKSLDTEIARKGDEISSLMSVSAEADSDIADGASKLLSKYQALKTQSKEMVGRYENYVREHGEFDRKHSEFMKLLNSYNAELKEHSQIVGDLGSLQEKQKKLRDMSDARSKKCVTYESLLGDGEKLYAHTSPDGREIIRLQLRELRSLWETTSEELQATMQKLDQCLLQLAEFTLAQEQLTNWLKDVEKAMQTHTGLKATLQEKKALLQNHKIVHQEVLGNQSLVASVCEKAQSLLDQTQDQALSAYLNSIKHLFDNIVSKSKELMQNLENNVESHEAYSRQYQEVRDWLSSERENVNICDDTTGEKADIMKRSESINTVLERLKVGKKKCEALQVKIVSLKKSTSKKGISQLEREKNTLEADLDQLIESLSGIQQKLRSTLDHWKKFEDELDARTKWFRVIEAAFRDQQLKDTLEEKQTLLNTYKQKRNDITEAEAVIDQFVDESHALLNTSGVDRIKPLISQISNRYQLLHILSKEVINRWQSQVEDHRNFDALYNETSACLEPLESKLANLESDNSSFSTKSSVLQSLSSELEQTSSKMSNLYASADKLYPDTAAAGRETIRQQIRDIRTRWETLEDGIKAQQKFVETHSIQWNSYQEALTQVLAWLDQMEKTLKQDTISVTSAHDIRCKLLKQKALLQEVLSHKRMVENVVEKAQVVHQLSKDPLPSTVTTLIPRHEVLVDHLHKSISNLEEFLDVIQVFGDLQKTHLDFQKHTKDRLTSFVDYGGSKAMLQGRLVKLQELSDGLREGTAQIKSLQDHISKNKNRIPPRSKEAMERDVSNMKFEFDKLSLAVSDAARELEGRIGQWSEYQASLDNLLSWMDEAEGILKSYSLLPTVNEKQQQCARYQDLLKLLDSRSRELSEVVSLSDHLDQSLLLSSRSQEDIDKLDRASPDSADQKLSVSTQQVTSRFHNIHSTCKDIVKMCEQAVADHVSYNSKYTEAHDWVNARKKSLDDANALVLAASQEQLPSLSEQLQNLVSLKPKGTLMLNALQDLMEKACSSTAIDGRELIRAQFEELQQLFESTFDSISDLDRDLNVRISSWSGFEEICENLIKWLNDMELQLPSEIELKATLDEKKSQLQSYRSLLQDTMSHQQDIIKLKHKIESLPEQSAHVQGILANITEKHSKIHAKAQSFVVQYEAIVNHHQEYCKAVMEVQEWVEATHNTVLLWGDTDLERVSIHTNLERLKNLQLSLPEEEPRVRLIHDLAEKVLPGTISSGQSNIRAQVDSSLQDWESLQCSIQSTINALELKLQHWSEYETAKDACLAWLRETDTMLHAIDLKPTAELKKAQLELLKNLQGEIRAKELEIDTVTEKAQQLHKPNTRSSHITELQHKYQQLTGKVKDLTSRWQQYVSRHMDFNSGVTEATQWIDGIKSRVQYCSNLNLSSQEDLDSKCETIQDLLLCKEEGFVRVQSCIEVGQTVLANTSPDGHETINKTLEALQQDWGAIIAKIVDTKNMLDECVLKWAGFLEQIHQLEKIVDQLVTSYGDVNNYQTTISEKRSQLDKIKALEEKVRCEKIEVDNLKSKASEMLASGQQNPAATHAQQVLQKFDKISDQIKSLLNERECQYREHRKFKEAQDDLSGWLNRARERLPALKQQPLSEKLAIEDCVAPLQALLNKQAQGELLLEQVQNTGKVAAASSSEQGQQLINNDVKALTESFNNLIRDIQAQKEQLEGLVGLWKNYKDEYEKISDWLQQMDIHIKAQKTALVSNLDDKKKQVKTVKDVLEKLEKGSDQLTKLNVAAEPLLKSHLDTYVNNQLRHINSRYEVLVNMAKDVLRKVETNYEQHDSYLKNLDKTRKWLEKAKDVIREATSSASTASKEVLQARLAQIQDLNNKREEGQNFVHMTVSSGEKVLRNTRSDGREEIQSALKEIQAEWERLIKKISTTKVHLETSLLQWADYSSSYSQLQQWISDREAKLMEVCEQKVSRAKRGQASGLGSLSIVERKATLRQTSSIVQDIVSFEPMIQSVTLKAEDLQQALPASEITSKYEILSRTAKELFEKQRETVEGHQAFIDAGNDFSTWVRTAKERLSKCEEPTGDKESLATKLNHLKILQGETPEGEKKLEVALQLGEVACALADADDKEVIEEEVVLLQDAFDNYLENLNRTKDLLESGIMKWSEYEDQYKEATEWLSKTEDTVQSFNKLQSTLEAKRATLELFQDHLQTLFGWQQQLDNLNLKAQVLLETCADTRVSNAMMQLTTKYNTLLSLAKEVMRRLELHYQEHQQHNSLYQECQQWVEKTKEKVATCSDMPNTIAEVAARLGVVKGLQQALEQGQNRLRYALELKEKVILNTEPSGVAKIQEDSESLKLEFEKLVIEVQFLRQALSARGAELEDIHKLHHLLKEWIKEMKFKAVKSDSNDISDTKAELEKFKGLAHQFRSQDELINNIKSRLSSESMPTKEFQDTITEFSGLEALIASLIGDLERQVSSYNDYQKVLHQAIDWIRRTRIEVQQCSDSHGEKNAIEEKRNKILELEKEFPEGEKLVIAVQSKAEHIIEEVGPESREAIKSDTLQLQNNFDSLRNLTRETSASLDKCLASWNDFNLVNESFKSWLVEFKRKLDSEKNLIGDENVPKTTSDLDRVRGLVSELNGKKANIEELSDKCETLMELCACNWVRDETVKAQSEYAEFFTIVQDLLSKVEKNLSDHTEFLKAKEEFESWLQRAHGTVKDCVGFGSYDWLKDRLQTVGLVTNRITEGQHLMSLMEDAYTRALDRTPVDQQDSLRETVSELHNSWDQLTIDLKSVTAQLNTAIARWDDFDDALSKINTSLDSTENKLSEDLDTKGEIGEMKTLLERFKHVENDLKGKSDEIQRLKVEAEELALWANSREAPVKVEALENKLMHVTSLCSSQKGCIENEIKDHNAYHQLLHDIEKWLLQVSFQLMAHNSLYITNKEQTQEQIDLHNNLLSDILGYQRTVDDLRSKGFCQIERYSKSNGSIKQTIEQQLSNVQDSYDSLLHTAQQIKSRLEESLEKFLEYERTLDSIMANLDDYEVQLGSDFSVSPDINAVKQQLELHRDIGDKLQGEKSRLSMAVAACEAAAACISRPSSPQDPHSVPVPDKEINVRTRLEDFIDLVEGRLGHLLQASNELEEKDKQIMQIDSWVGDQMSALNEWKNKPWKLRADLAKSELAGMSAIHSGINDNRTRLLVELPQGGRAEATASRLDELEALLNDILAKKQDDESQVDAYRAACANAQQKLEGFAKQLELVEKGHGLELPRRMTILDEIAADCDKETPLVLSSIKKLGEKAGNIVSNIDAQQIDEQVKSFDKKFNDLGKKIKRKKDAFRATNDELDGINETLGQAKEWVDLKQQFVRNPPKVGYDAKSSEERVQALKNLMKETEGKKIVGESCERRLNNISPELENFEIKQVEQKIKALMEYLGDLGGEVKNALEAAKEASEDRKNFEKKHESLREKLRQLAGRCCEAEGVEPLSSAVVERLIKDNKKYKDDLKKFETQDLGGLQKQGAAIMKDCGDPEREELNKLLAAVGDEFEKYSAKADQRDRWLKNLLGNRHDFEAQTDKIRQWLNEAEVALSSDVRLSSLQAIQDQLNKYKKLNEECNKVKGDIDSVKGSLRSMNLTAPDRLMADDLVNGLDQRQQKIARDIASKLDALGNALEEQRQILEKVDKSNMLIKKVQDCMKDLAKPVGSKVEDAESAIDGYQKLLDELKRWKNDLGGEGVEGLSAVHASLRDLINALEDEIAHLQDLLRLRQQYLALIAEITTFITTYTPIVTQIESSPQPIPEKIKKLDDVILKIQHCEALLASAFDKGERIASEGSAVDQNSIMEQLQSLKQQLQALKRAVETARQKLLDAEQEHLKMTKELDKLIDWLHAHEVDVKSRPLLDLTLASVEREAQKHQDLEKEIGKHLNEMEKIVQNMKNKDDLPGSLQERMSEASTLLQTIPKELKEREQYLTQNKNYRINYESLKNELMKWIEDANEKTRETGEGFDLDELPTILNNHSKFFSDEKKLHDLVSIDIHKAGQSIVPSLNADDQETLNKRREGFSQSLRNTLNTAKSFEAKLNQAVEQLKAYAEALIGAESTLQRIYFVDEPVSSLGGLKFNLEKIEQALKDAQHCESDIELLKDRMNELVGFLNRNSSSKIESEVKAVQDKWQQLLRDLEMRKNTLSNLAVHWKDFEDILHSLDTKLTAVDDKSKNIEILVSNEAQLQEGIKTLQGLCDTLEELEPQKLKALESSKPVLTFLQAVSPDSHDEVKARATSTATRHAELLEKLKEKLSRLLEASDLLEKTSSSIEDYKSLLDALTREIVELYVFHEDQDAAEVAVTNIRKKVESNLTDVQNFLSRLNKMYKDLQQGLPSGLVPKITELELKMENIQNALDAKRDEQRRARTTRNNYNGDKEILSAWLQDAELKVQDRTSQPQYIKEALQHVQSQLLPMQNRLDELTQNGKFICSNTNDDVEKAAIKETVDALTEQFGMIRAWIDEKKQQIGGSLDSWDRFMTLYNTVMNWVQEKQLFLQQPLYLGDLEQAKTKSHEYAGAVKTCKNMGKTLSEMSKELENIGETCSTGDLSELLEKAETAKCEVEGQLLERHALLHETNEEWEQCERKLREVRSWLSKTNGALEHDAGKKKPLRDRLATKEKVMADIAIQKSKIDVSVEKLQVHFKSGLTGCDAVPIAGAALKAELDTLMGVVRQQSIELEEAISQVEQYQQELLHLKQDVTETEQKLRTVSSPNYLSNDRELAVAEQNACKEKIRTLQSKISANTERVKLLIQRGTPDLDPLISS